MYLAHEVQQVFERASALEHAIESHGFSTALLSRCLQPRGGRQQRRRPLQRRDDNILARVVRPKAQVDDAAIRRLDQATHARVSPVSKEHHVLKRWQPRTQPAGAEVSREREHVIGSVGGIPPRRRVLDVLNRAVDEPRSTARRHVLTEAVRAETNGEHERDEEKVRLLRVQCAVRRAQHAAEYGHVCSICRVDAPNPPAGVLTQWGAGVLPAEVRKCEPGRVVRRHVVDVDAGETRARLTP